MALLTDDLRAAFRAGEQQGRQGEQLKIANDALYPSYGDSWRDEIDPGPIDPEPGDPVFGVDETGQTFFEFVKQLQINPELANRIRGPRTPNTIRGIPHIDSNFIDQKIKNNWQMLQPPVSPTGPQLPPFVQNPTQGENLMIAGNPFGYSDEYINRSKTLFDIINDRGTDPSTLREAQKQWIKIQQGTWPNVND